ncbi:MAG: serine/threonine-protein phosphatase [Polyangiaceae bacterium]|nr:serine/threonine-protein phosphatase [Polyangiaceae bacterium]
MVFRSYALTHVGRRRKQNEDAFLRDDAINLWIVADGMGGHAAGEVASSEAVDTVFGMVKRGLPALGDTRAGLDENLVAQASRLVESAIQAATYMVFAISEVEKAKSGMGTTMSVALGVGNVLITGQVGDSRIYQVRDDMVTQLTEDHTLVAWQVKQGLITQQEAAVSPHRNVITRSVGGRDYVEVDISVLDLKAGDRYLLCSDGLHGYLDDVEIPDLVSLGGDAAVEAFVGLANERGGSDNITVVLVEVDVV